MSIMKQRNIRDLMRQEGAALRSNENIPERAKYELTSLVDRISREPIGEVDRLIDGLKQLRKQLDENGRRVQNAIVDHATFSQSVTQLTKIVSEGMSYVGEIETDSPGISSEALTADMIPERQI